MRLSFRAAYRLEFDDFAILVGLEDAEGRLVSIAKPVEFIEYTRGKSIAEPTISTDVESAQVLMNALWAAGVRPRESGPGMGALEATQKHLEDMRTIALSHPGLK